MNENFDLSPPIHVKDIASFRFELIKMIEQVKYQTGDYSLGSSSEVAEKFENKIRCL